MSLIEKIIIGIVQLALLGIDILMLLVIVEIIYACWKPPWLKNISGCIEPIIASMTNYARRLAAEITCKTPSERTLLPMIIVCLWLVRFSIVILANLFV